MADPFQFNLRYLPCFASGVAPSLKLVSKSAILELYQLLRKRIHHYLFYSLVASTRLWSRIDTFEGIGLLRMRIIYPIVIKFTNAFLFYFGE